jgi:hypothetical protein
MIGFIRHIAQRLIPIKKSATFGNSIFWVLIPSIGRIPSQVAPQQSLSPFNPTNKDIKTELTQFILHSRKSRNLKCKSRNMNG